MKTRFFLVFAAALSLPFLNATSLAQGSLTPPGPPAPVMKSLDQIEPRTAITNTNSLVIISQPGSYYLTQNLTIASGTAVEILTNNVTLDLNGFSLISTDAGNSGNAVFLALSAGNTGITIRNGNISGAVTESGGVYNGAGFANGIFYNSASNNLPYDVRVSGLNITGCRLSGIYLGVSNSTVVESCTIKTAGSTGIYADNVSKCVATDCNNGGIGAVTASDCRGQAIIGPGVSALTAANCTGTSSGSGDGLDATTANNCYGESGGSQTGLNATVAIGCYGKSASGIGLNANLANSCVIG